jgi:acetyl esterase/lipase
MMPVVQQLVIELDKDRALVDDPLGVRVSGCQPGELVSLTVDGAAEGVHRRAWARFRANEAGWVDTATDASLAGTYEGVDGFGLWTSGESVGPAQVAPAPAPAPLTYTVLVEQGDRCVSRELTRFWLGEGVTVRPVAEDGVRGLYARPPGSGPFPAVVAFAGSGGGLGPSASWAMALASRGVAVLAIAYFGAAQLPPSLEGIEVEVVERAIAWMQGRRGVDPGTVGLLGMSRGSELALWAGVLLADVGPVVCFAPSGISWEGLGPHGPTNTPAWTFRGQPLPYAHIGAGARATGKPTTGPVVLRSVFEDTLEDPRTTSALQEATIPVERIAGPILLVSGDADAMWPSTRLSDIITHRAGTHGDPMRVTHLRFTGAGHVGAGVPGLPVVTQTQHPLTGELYLFGGTPQANAHARAASWPTVVSLLSHNTPHLNAQ